MKYKLNQPLVSIIVPCFNQSDFLPETLSSVILQTYSNWECILVNDGSNDQTEGVALSFKERDERFKYFFQDNMGVSAARNNGIAYSQGKYILPLDADDIIDSRYIEISVSILEENHEVKLVYANAEKFGEETGFWDLEDFDLNKLLLNNMIYCSAIYRREDYNLTNGYNVNMKEGLEDWDFWISLLKNGGRVYKIPEILFFYRIKKVSRNKMIVSDREKRLKTQLFINHYDIYVQHWGDPISTYLEKEVLQTQLDRIRSSIYYRLYKKAKKFSTLFKFFTW